MNIETMISAMSGNVSSIDDFYYELKPRVRKYTIKFVTNSNIEIGLYTYLDLEDIIHEVLRDSFTRIIKNFNLKKMENSLDSFIDKVIFNSIKTWITQHVFNNSLENDVDPISEIDASYRDSGWTPEDKVLFESLQKDIFSKVESYKETD